MKRAWKQILVAFVLGGCVGVAVTWGCAPRMFHRHAGKGQFQQRLLDRFSSKLQLTPEQRTQVAAILDTKRQKMDALRAEIRPRVEELRASTSADIRRLLTPDQQQRFDVMEKEWSAKTKRFHDHWMGTHGA
ncbi:MAG: periplasmic heavy metal sensor [Candidatus Omnitrophica bacterium]|nr:periplasmic heavy metal sensor [Candidatus Omnitrophota bacterium]